MVKTVERARKKLKQNAGELQVAAQLEELKVKYSFEPHSFKYSIPATYTPDFTVTKADGTDMYVEVKGYHAGMQQWASKIRHFIEQNPEVDYRIVFLDANKKFNKRYKSNLGQWATKLGILWSDKGRVPTSWLK